MARYDTAWLPPWVFEVATPLWITGPDGTVSLWNDHAHRLFGIGPDDALGHPCHERVGAVDSNGIQFCKRHCQIRAQARSRSGFGPYRARVIDVCDQWHDIHLIVLALCAPDGSKPWLCHLALAEGHSAVLMQYVNRVAKRSDPAMDVNSVLESSGLSARELDLLHLLAEDRSLKEAAFDLSISYNTVRNHAKNIRRKLRVHSTHEALARYLLNALHGQTRPS